MPTFLPSLRTPASAASCVRRRSRTLLTTLGLLATTTATASAQVGTVTFGGAGNGAAPTVAFGFGPTLGFSSRVLTGFGNQTTVPLATGLWWTGQYSGQGMLYGNNSTLGNVLEVRLEAASGLDLLLTGSLFGGWLNKATNVSYRLYSDDYSQSTSLATVLTSSLTPANATFGANGWGRAIRLQFTETDANGMAFNQGAWDVGIQDIAYTARVTSVVPEPESFVLLAIGMVILGAGLQRRRARQS